MSQLAKRHTLSLRQQWRVFDKQNSSPKAYLDLCGRMIQVGEFLLAHDVAKEGLGKHKNDWSLSQKAAHALCKRRWRCRRSFCQRKSLGSSFCRSQISFRSNIRRAMKS